MPRLVWLLAMVVAATALAGCGVVRSAAPEVVALPPSVDFGKVGVKTKAPIRGVAFTNTSLDAAVVEDLTFSGGPVFSIALNTCKSGTSLPHDDVCSVAFSFNASQAGRYRGSVRVPFHYHGSTATRVVTVTLSGTAYRP